MTLLRLEVNCYAPVEVVGVAHLSESPCVAEHERTLLAEGDELFEPHERLVQRHRAELHPVQKRPEQPVVRRLLQRVADSDAPERALEVREIVPHEFQRAFEVLLSGALLHTVCQRFRVSHLFLRSEIKQG